MPTTKEHNTLVDTILNSFSFPGQPIEGSAKYSNVRGNEHCLLLQEIKTGKYILFALAFGNAIKYVSENVYKTTSLCCQNANNWDNTIFCNAILNNVAADDENTPALKFVSNKFNGIVCVWHYIPATGPTEWYVFGFVVGSFLLIEQICKYFMKLNKLTLHPAPTDDIAQYIANSDSYKTIQVNKDGTGIYAKNNVLYVCGEDSANILKTYLQNHLQICLSGSYDNGILSIDNTSEHLAIYRARVISAIHSTYDPSTNHTDSGTTVTVGTNSDNRIDTVKFIVNSNTNPNSIGIVLKCKNSLKYYVLARDAPLARTCVSIFNSRRFGTTVADSAQQSPIRHK